MAESTLSLTHANIKAEVGLFLGWTRDSGNWSVESRDDIIESIVRDGEAQAYVPPKLKGQKLTHEWSWLKPTTSFSTTGPYSTGTVTVVAGVVTLAGGTFPTWAAGQEIVISGIAYTVSTRDSGTQLTLGDTSVAYAALTTYSLVHPYYTLPDNFGGILGPITYRPGTSTLWGPLEQVGEWNIRAERQVSDYTMRPTKFALRNVVPTGSASSRWQIVLWRTPDDAYELFYRYRVSPNATSSTGYPYGGPAFAQCVLESCLAVAERRMNDTRGLHQAAFEDALQSAVDYDQQFGASEYGGVDRDRSDERPLSSMGSYHDLSNNYVSYYGHDLPY